MCTLRRRRKEGGLTMGFTTPCFIRKNTTNIRNRLKELGYYCNPYLGWHNLCICIFGITPVYSCCDDDINALKEIEDLIDCGTNEELFLALAALRNDTDKNQWFTDGDLWFKCGDEVCNETIEYYLNKYGRKIHKATVDELIEHFKIKEE